MMVIDRKALEAVRVLASARRAIRRQSRPLGEQMERR
jgi:hypothetical protein